MSRMSELDISIRERIAAGEHPRHIAESLRIPVAWVSRIEDEMYMDDRAQAEAFADADAEAYGCM